MTNETLERPQFGPADLPLTREQLLQRRDWAMDAGNWRDDHTVPSEGEHYRYMWYWDSLKAVVINARRGRPDKSALELTTLQSFRDAATGFLPNKIFATATHKTWRDYPEAWNFNNNKIGSSYTQPPIEAWAAMETYRSFTQLGRQAEGLEFLRSVYGTAEPGNYTGLQGGYAYFTNHRQNSPEDPLTGITHPNETGRDSDEANKPWLAFADRVPNAKKEWLQMQKLGYDLGRLGRDPQGKRLDWIPSERLRERYWVNDVMMNALYVSNLRYLADIADLLGHSADANQHVERYAADSERYRQLAGQVEHEILTRMWDGRQGFFYNLDSRGKKIPVESISGLFPLLLENIDDRQLDSLLTKLEDPAWFAAPFPIPTHAAVSAFYDPEPDWFKRTFTPPWSGATWISPNQLLVEEGLVPRAAADGRQTERAMAIAGRIARQTLRLLAMNEKSMECYGAETGRGMRIENFMWTHLGLHFENYHAAAARLLTLMGASDVPERAQAARRGLL